ncbi:hypothetical protein F4808DRAFT_469663, partial [Astrocystis sublimbata]
MAPCLVPNVPRSPTGDQASMIYIPCWMYLFLCPLVVGVKVWSRKRTDGGLGTDDYTILASVVFALSNYVMGLWGVSLGYGKHVENLSTYQIHEAMKYFLVGQVTYKISLSLTKISILLLYLRIFGTVRWLKWSCYVFILTLVVYCTIATSIMIFQCNPISVEFEVDRKGGRCINMGPLWYTNAIVSTVSDLVILVLPMPIICRLEMRIAKKLSLVLLFGLGTAVMFASALRITSLDDPTRSPDPLYDVTTTMWSIIEMSLAIVCACLPQIFRLLVKLFPKLEAAVSSIKSRINVPKADGNQPRVSEDQGWTRVGPRACVGLTNVICRGESSPDTFSLHEPSDRGTKILKTIDYSLEFSNNAASRV